jgi:phosphoribosylformimino-5-aminoimidazole carboxamide ribotide isomerase
MFRIIPSISIIDGKVVRLEQGDFSKNKAYSESPIDAARRFQDHGIKTIHLLDLDGAKRGSPVNYHVLEAIAAYTKLEIDFTGGIQNDGDLIKAFEAGATYVTASTVSVFNPELFASWIISYGREKIALGADSLNNKIAVKGWLKNTDIDLFDHLQSFYNRGLKYVKCTDISREGLMAGPSFELYEDIVQKFPDLCLLASGGLRNVDDIIKLQEIGVAGVIFGKAYYEGKIKLKELEQFLS